MGWSGGNYTKGNAATGGWTGDASLGIGIEAGRHDTQDNDFASGIDNCIAKDGQNFATADLPMNTKKHTNVGNASARNHYAAAGQVQDGSFVWLGTTGGTATAQTATATPAITAYVAGQKFRAKIGTSLQSTGTTVTAHTININSVGAKNIVNQDGTNPTAGTWVAGAIIELVYDGTNFVITNDPSGWQTFNPVATGVAPMTVATQSNLLAEYRKKGKEVMVAWDIQVTLGGTASNGLNITMPVNAAYSGASSQYVFGNPLVSSGGAQAIGVIYFSTASNAIINRDGGATPANYSLAGNTYIRLIWTYRGV